MDAMKLLGSLLSGKSLSSTLGQQLLGGIFGGGKSKESSSGGGMLQGLFKKFTGGFGGLGGATPAALSSSAAATETEEPDQQSANDQAILLIRAMVCAAKSDGRVDQVEQDKIIGKLGDVTQDEIDFLKSEFASNIDVDDFARSIPSGMEQQVYAVSLTAIDLDTQNEARYLDKLAKGLNLSPSTCNDIHEQCGAPTIYS